MSQSDNENMTQSDAWTFGGRISFAIGCVTDTLGAITYMCAGTALLYGVVIVSLAVLKWAHLMVFA